MILRVVVFFMLMIGFPGCSTVSNVKDATVKATKATMEATTKIVPYMGGPDTGIIRKAALIQFRNETQFQQFPLESVFERMVVQYLTESCSGVVLLLPEDPDYPEYFDGLAVSPPWDTMTMITEGRISGLNAVITGAVLNLTIAREDEGILWFRETKETLQIQFSVVVYDLETGAKIFDDRFIQEIKDMDPADIQAVKAGQPGLFASVTENIDKTANNIAPKICSAIMAQPWTGYVVAVEDKQVRLSFGQKIGIETGNVLEVYAKGQVVENVQGEKFILPGKKIGEIKVLTTEEQKSTGEIISGENIEIGNPVKIKE